MDDSDHGCMGNLFIASAIVFSVTILPMMLLMMAIEAYRDPLPAIPVVATGFVFAFLSYRDFRRFRRDEEAK